MKIIKDYQRFFKNLVSISADYNLDIFYLTWSVATAPSVLFNQKLLKDISKRLNAGDFDMHASTMKYLYDYIAIVAKGQLPNDSVIESMYRNFLKDYKGYTYTYNDVLEDFGNDRDMMKNHYPPFEWWVADCLYKLSSSIPTDLKKDIATQLRELIEKEHEKELQMDELAEQDKEMFKRFGGFMTLFDQFTETRQQDPDLQNVERTDAIAMLLRAKKIGEHYLFETLQMDFLHYLYKMVYNTAGEAVDLTQEYKHELDQTNKKYEKAKKELLTVKAEKDLLINKVGELDSELNKTQYASKALALNKQLHQQVNQLQIELDDVKAKAGELKEENKMLKEMTQSEPANSLTENNKPNKIIYFGLDNPDLEQEFKKQEIEFITLSPFTKPVHIPEGLIVINIDCAKHKVWEVIKSYKPIIVTGSNGKLLSEKILAFCT